MKLAAPLAPASTRNASRIGTLPVARRGKEEHSSGDHATDEHAPGPPPAADRRSRESADEVAGGVRGVHRSGRGERPVQRGAHGGQQQRVGESRKTQGHGRADRQAQCYKQVPVG
ncbi:MAG: hypothetical protein WCC38_06545 [Pseudonocardiaceae bacterium]